jgi:hypothetical protein
MATDSLLTNLKNKIAYKIHNAVTDPEAEEYAKARQRSTIEGADETGAPTDTSAAVTTGSEEDTRKSEDKRKPPVGDPNIFSIKRIATNIWDNLVTAVTVGFLPMVAIILSVFIANEMIVYSPIIRLAFFVFTFIICYFFTPFLIGLSCYYIGRAGYAYHINNMTEQPKVDGIPHIFAFLPLMPYTVSSEKSAFKDFFLSPFYYLVPTATSYKEDQTKITSLMNKYYDSLKESFKYYDKVKDIKNFKENYDKVEYQIKHLHDTIATNTAITASAVTTNAVLPNTVNAKNTAKQMENLTSLEKEKTQFFAPQPMAEEPKTEEPRAIEEPKVTEPKVTEPNTTKQMENLKDLEKEKTQFFAPQPKAEEPQVEEPKVEEPKAEEQKAEEEPKA